MTPKIKYVYAVTTTTDGRRILYMATEDGGTGDVEVIEEKVK